MRKNCQGTDFWVLIKPVLIIQLCYFHHLFTAEANGIHFENEFETFQNGDESISLKTRMSKAEVKIKQQGEEIIGLKTIVEESRNVINQLSNRLADLGETTAISSKKNHDKDLLFRQKRPFRLVPV